MYYIIDKKIDENWDNACIIHHIKLFIKAGRCYDSHENEYSKTKIFINATILNFKSDIPSDCWTVNKHDDYLDYIGRKIGLKGKEIYEEMFIDRLVVSSSSHYNDSTMDVTEFDDLDAGLLYFNLIN